MPRAGSNSPKFEDLAMQHLPRLYRLAYLRLRSKEDAEDVVQETYLKAFRAFESHHEGHLEAWLTTILLNTIRDHVRKSSRTPTDALDQIEDHDYLQSMADKSPGPEQQLEEKEIDTALDEALKTTPEWMLSPFLLRELQDMTYKQIAQTLSIPIGTVMSRLARARQHLCDKLSSKEPSTKNKQSMREESP